MNTWHDERAVFLRDGRGVVIRPLQPGDRAQVAALFARLSPGSLALRFHSPGLHITPAVLDHVTAGYGLVAELEGRVVALASYHPQPDGRAEIGLVVDEVNQRRGIGTLLCDVLCREARRAGFTRLRAEVLSSNEGMLRLLHGLHRPMTRTTSFGVVEVEIALSPEAA
jgi:ribosomal protein S18 acetylase RimI-like enzyme